MRKYSRFPTFGDQYVTSPGSQKLGDRFPYGGCDYVRLKVTVQCCALGMSTKTKTITFECGDRTDRLVCPFTNVSPLPVDDVGIMFVVVHTERVSVSSSDAVAALRNSPANLITTASLLLCYTIFMTYRNGFLEVPNGLASNWVYAVLKWFR